MALTPRLDQRQSQSLVMTPQLQQAIKLLQLSSFELNEFVEKELETNPMLERAEDHESKDYLEGEETTENTKTKENIENLADINFNSPEATNLNNSFELDADGDSMDSNEPETAPSRELPDPVFNDNITRDQTRNFNEKPLGLEQILSEDISLKQHLTEQVVIDFSNVAERLIASHLIELIDETGYFTENLEGIAANLGCDQFLILSVLKKLQQFDPPGIFARDLQECLTIQLKDLERYDPFMEKLLQNLDLLADKKISKLASICGVDREDLNEMLSELRSLNPKPGLKFENHLSQPVVPDVLVLSKPGGGWLIELNTDTLPKVLVNNEYHSQVFSKAKTKEEKL